MSRAARRLRGRRATPLAWLAAVLLLALSSGWPLASPLQDAGRPGAGARAAGPDTTAPRPGPDPATRPVPRDTTGQARLEWQVERPRRAASLLQADRSVYRIIDGEAISYYYGNVYLDRDTVVVRADSAHVFRDRDVVRLFDNVRLRHLETRIASDWAEYRRDLGEADLRGRVRVVEGVALATARRGELREDLQLLRLFEDAILVTPDYNVRADTLLRDRRLEYGEAFGDVRIVDPDGGSLVTGRHALFASDGSWAEVDRDPALVTADGEGGAPVQSVAERMRFFRREERAVMTDSVVIAQGRLRAYADTAISYGQERMILRGAPRLEQGQRSRMYGDQIEFFYREGRLRRVILLGQARMEDTEPESLAALYRGLPDLDVIEGDSITVHFRGGRIERTDVVGNASSLYVPLETGDEIAYNEVAGDTLVLRFERQRVREVEVRGNMSGIYRFARVGAMRGELAPLPDAAALDSLRAVSDSLFAAGDTTAASAVRRRVAAAAVRLAAAAVRDTSLAAGDSLLVGLTAPRDTLAALAAGDTLRQAVTPPDTAAAAAAALAGADTLAAAAAASDTLDFTAHAEEVVYSGHRVLFDLPERSIAISDEASLTYGSMTLTARDVILDTESRELYADGDPVIEDAQTIVGDQMGYDFGNKTGAVRRGVTTFDGYYYTGQQINRYPDSSLKICSGRMTSCDLAEPHYHFWADRMKMRLDDRVVAAPIVLKVGHVPLFALPFYFKSLKDGRRSGILFPNFNFGWSARDGRYIRDFGYYWATNDYTDFSFEVDYNERRELAWRVRNRYVKRYSFNGGFEYNRLLQLDEEATRGDEWQFRWNHSQPKLMDDYSFRGSIEATSQELSRNDLGSDTGRDVINTYQKSTLYLSRSNFAWGAATLSADRIQYVNAEDDDPTTDNQLYAMTLPSLSISPRRFSLAPELRPGQDGSFLGDLARNTDVSHGYRFNHDQSATEQIDRRGYQAAGNWSLTLRPPRLGIFNWNLGASSSYTWQRNVVDGFRYQDSGVDTIPGTWEDISSETEETRPALSFNTGLSTTLYGVFPVRIGALQALRHTLSLSASASYRPQIGDDQRRSNSYSFGIGNRFDVKYLASGERDTAATVKKLDGLVNWDLRSSYNPDAAQQWSEISSSLTIKAGRSRNLNFKLSNTIDPYALALTSTRFTYGFGLDGRFDSGYGGEERVDQRSDAAAILGPAGADTLASADQDTAWGEDEWEDWEQGEEFDDDIYGGNFGTLGGDGEDRRDPTEGGRFIPWDLGGNLSLNRTARSDDITARANLSVNAQFTRDWSLRYTASFDLAEGTTTRQEYRLARDLHCWRLEFTRTVSTVNSEFGFRFYLKAIPELKLTRGREGLLGGTGGMGSFMP